MFRKLVSNLSFNPSLIGQLTFYSKRMHQEQSVRRAGLLMVCLAMVIQIFAVISPPQSSMARAGNDIIPGGVTSQGDMVNHCKANDYGFATILAHFGIDCNALYFGEVKNINSRDYGNQLFSMGRVPYGKPQETPVRIPGLGTFYMRPLSSWDSGSSSTYKAVTGHRADGTPFMVLFDCGNLVIVGKPPTQPPQEKEISCKRITLSVQPNSRVEINTEVKVSGKAKGQNLPSGQKVDMFYDVVKVGTGRVIDTKEARGVAFSGNTAEDSRPNGFKLTKAGHYKFRLAVKYDGNKEASGNQVGSCASDVYVATQPNPEKVIECTNLISSFSNGQKIIAGSNVNVRGQASGNNLPTDQKVDMYYDYVDSSGKVISSQNSKSIAFDDGIAEDQVAKSFKLDNPGTYTFRLAVKYGNNKDANGNQTGNCAKQVVVEPPCNENDNDNGTQCILLSKKARNDTQNIENASGTTARAGDTIIYTLMTTNTSKNTTAKGYVVQENLIDIMQYADIVNLSGGKLDDKGIATWPATDIAPEKTINTLITVKIKNPIPQTPVSSSDPGSFDMTLTNIYGNKVDIKLPPSVIKTTEHVAGQLPNTGPGETLAVGFLITSIAGYFFARSRLIAKETDLIRSEFASSGGL